MAEIDIAIRYKLTLDVKKADIPRDKNQCKQNDDIILDIDILEGGVVKQLSDNCNVSLLYSIQDLDGNVVSYRQSSQDGGFTITQTLERTNITIKVKDSFAMTCGTLFAELVISDTDESISTQMFKFVVKESINGKVVSEAYDSINTIEELDRLIEAEKLALIELRQTVLNISNGIDMELLSINNKILAENQKVDLAITDIDNKINDMNEVFDTQVIKIINLSLYDKAGSSVVYFTTDNITKKASSLLDKTFMLSVGGFVADKYYNTSIGSVAFTLENGMVKANYIPSIDKNIGGSTVGVIVMFSNSSNTINSEVTNFKLLIQANIKKSLNNGELKAFARLTPISNGLLV